MAMAGFEGWSIGSVSAIVGEGLYIFLVLFFFPVFFPGGLCFWQLQAFVFKSSTRGYTVSIYFLRERKKGWLRSIGFVCDCGGVALDTYILYTTYTCEYFNPGIPDPSPC